MNFFMPVTERKSLFATAAIWILIAAVCAVMPAGVHKEQFEPVSIRLLPAVPPSAGTPAETSGAASGTRAGQSAAAQSSASDQPSAAAQSSASDQPSAAAPQNASAAQQASSARPADAVPAAPTRATAAKPAAAQQSAPRTSAKKQPEKSAQPVKKAVPREEVLVPDINDLITRQTSTPKKTAAWDDSLFSDAPEVSSAAAEIASNTAPVRPLPESALSGNAAVAADPSATAGDGHTAVVQNNRTRTTGSGSTNRTEEALRDIAAAASSGTASAFGGTSSGAAAGAASAGNRTGTNSGNRAGNNAAGTSSGSASGTVMRLDDGSLRQLLFPEKPEISIPAALQKMLDTSKSVTVVFDISSGGAVIPGTVKITPAGALPVEIQLEIAKQVSQWRFSIASSNGQARFPYSINIE